MDHDTMTAPALAGGTVRKLSPQELPLLRDHLLRLDRDSRHDRFNGFIDSGFIERYAAKCATDGTIVMAYVENGIVRAAAELHQPDLSSNPLPEVAFSVETSVRRKGLGSILFTQLIGEAKSLGYERLRITTGAQNDAMRALAHKFGAKLTFRHGESTGTIDLDQPGLRHLGKPAIATPVDIARAVTSYHRAWWKMMLKVYGFGNAA